MSQSFDFSVINGEVYEVDPENERGEGIKGEEKKTK